MGITLPREQLYRRCDLRVEQMLSSGLEEEVCTLLSAGLSPKAQSMQGIGYKEIAAELSGELSRSEAIELLKKNTRHLAKRQLTTKSTGSMFQDMNRLQIFTRKWCGIP